MFDKKYLEKMLDWIPRTKKFSTDDLELLSQELSYLKQRLSSLWDFNYVGKGCTWDNPVDKFTKKGSGAKFLYERYWVDDDQQSSSMKSRIRDSEPCMLEITQIQAAVKQGSFTVEDLIGSCYKRASCYDEKINSFISIRNLNELLQDWKIQSLVEGSLTGIPIAYKDGIATAGIKTTHGSNAFRDNIPDEDAYVVDRYKREGAIVFGKTNLCEFGRCYTFSGEPHNPWNLKYPPGDSSSGSAAALAARFVPAAVGTDGCGSIRVPASFSGVVGLKPTHGLVSNYGTMPSGWTLGQIGPMARSVIDVGILLRAIAGYDSRDPRTKHIEVPDFNSIKIQKRGGIIIGVPKSWIYASGTDVEVYNSFKIALEVLGRIPEVSILEIPLELARFSQTVAFTILKCESYIDAERNLNLDIAHQSRRVRIQGGLIPASCYIRARVLQQAIFDEFMQAFSRVDVIVTPTTPITAAPPKETIGSNNDPTFGGSEFTSAANLLGAPALSVPAGFSSRNLPIGLQFMGMPYSEVLLLYLGREFQKNTDWHTLIPTLKE